MRVKFSDLEQSSHIRYAGFWPRLLAHNIDLLPILGLFYVSTFLPFEEFGIPILGAIYLGYHMLFELRTGGATPGKRLVKIKTVCIRPNSPKVLAITVRNVFKFVSLGLFFAGFIMIFFNPRRQALHDYIGGTVVLFEED